MNSLCVEETDFNRIWRYFSRIPEEPLLHDKPVIAADSWRRIVVAISASAAWRAWTFFQRRWLAVTRACFGLTSFWLLTGAAKEIKLFWSKHMRFESRSSLLRARKIHTICHPLLVVVYNATDTWRIQSCWCIMRIIKPMCQSPNWMTLLVGSGLKTTFYVFSSNCLQFLCTTWLTYGNV